MDILGMAELFRRATEGIPPPLASLAAPIDLGDWLHSRQARLSTAYSLLQMVTTPNVEKKVCSSVDSRFITQAASQ